MKGSIARRCVAIVGLCAALGWCGCAAPLGDGAGAREPGEEAGSILHEFRVIELSGFTYEPLIEIVSSQQQLRSLVKGEDPLPEIDFAQQTVLYVSWYRPDPCTTRTLDKVVQVSGTGSAKLIYTTERAADQFCPQVIAPFEQLVITDPGCDSAVLVIDEEVVASWPNP